MAVSSPMTLDTSSHTRPGDRLEPPAALTSALNANPEAALRFAALSASCQREYVQWIAEAKRPQTRERRIASALAMMVAGKA